MSGTWESTPRAHVGTDRVAQQFYGLRGVNDALYRREDRQVYKAERWDDVYDPEIDDVVTQYTPASYTEPDGVFDNQAFYQLSDIQFSVVSVVAARGVIKNSSGVLVADATPRRGLGGSFGPGRTMEMNEYDPYGRSRRTLSGDYNHDGQNSVDDNSGFLGGYFASPVKWPADTDENGVSSVDDINVFLSTWYVSESRTHNQANELEGFTNPTLGTGVNSYAAAPVAVPMAYTHDDDGNRTQMDSVNSSGNGFKHKLVYDAWNRLVEIKKATVTGGSTGSYGTAERYAYGGLHHRVSKTEYSTPGGSTGKRRWFTYNASWQAIVEEIDDDYGVSGTPPTAHAGTDRVMLHHDQS
jgi:hypothetical protein